MGSTSLDAPGKSTLIEQVTGGRAARQSMLRPSHRRCAEGAHVTGLAIRTLIAWSRLVAEGMNHGRKEGMKTKVSISLPRDLVEEIDEEATRTSRSRSQIFEIWLRLAGRRRAAEKLEQDTLAYYASRTAEQEAEDEALSQASLHAARKRKID